MEIGSNPQHPINTYYEESEDSAYVQDNPHCSLQTCLLNVARYIEATYSSNPLMALMPNLVGQVCGTRSGHTRSARSGERRCVDPPRAAAWGERLGWYAATLR